MMNRHVFEAIVQAALSNGTTTGKIEVIDPTRFPIGAEVWLTPNGGGTAVRHQVIAYASSPQGLVLRNISEPNVANPQDLSAFLAGSRVSCSPVIIGGQLTPMDNQLIPGATTKVDVGGVDASATLIGGVQYRVVCDVDCWLKVGGAATASTDMYLVAKVPEVFCFGHQGSAPVLHAIAGGAGKLYITPMIPTLNG